MAVYDRFRDAYLHNNPAELLVVGHTDTTAEPAINDPLSLERAVNTAAFLVDDVEARDVRLERAAKLACIGFSARAGS
jgi:outer membrane protein OmpA-like peptidoglycan-associated protein